MAAVPWPVRAQPIAAGGPAQPERKLFGGRDGEAIAGFEVDTLDNRRSYDLPLRLGGSSREHRIAVMTTIRKTVVLREIIATEMGAAPARPIIRVAGLAVVANPFAGRYEQDLSTMFPIGRLVGERMMPELVALLGGPAISYGKAALVGVAGEMEHGGACVHPMLGKPMRAAIGGGKAVIPSNVKIGAAGATIDVPLGHKDEPWSFDHFDTITVMLADAPRPDEIVVVIALADGGRPLPRCGQAPL